MSDDLPADSEAGSAEGGLTEVVRGRLVNVQGLGTDGFAPGPNAVTATVVDAVLASDWLATRDAQIRADERQRVLGEVERRLSARQDEGNRTGDYNGGLAGALRIVEDMRGET
jgi:hypothetical protein